MDRPSLSDMLAQVKDIENLVRLADVPGNVNKVSALALSIARNAPDTVAAPALQLLNAVNAWERSGQPRAEDIQLSKAVWRLGVALQDAQRDSGTR